MQKLSEEQRKLIEDNYSKVLQGVKKHFRKKRYKNIAMENKDTSVLQCVSYVVEAALSWKPEKSKTGDFTQFAIHRCIRRFIDECRKHSENYNEYNNSKKNGLEPNYHRLIPASEEFYNNLISKTENLSDIECKEYYQDIVSKSEKFFNNQSNYKSQLHKQLIQEYILPKIFNKKLSLSEVANKLGVKRNTAYLILKSKKMRKFFKTVISDESIRKLSV
jgi:predicted transcriptional regulator YheO